MKILYDNIVFSLQDFGGISTYWYELVSRLIRRTDIDSKFIDYNASRNILRQQLNFPADVLINETSSRYMLFERFRNPPLKSCSEKFIFHSSYNRYSGNRFAKNVSTVHDFTHQHFYTGARALIHNRQKYHSLEKSDAIIAVSHSTKQDLLKVLPKIDPGKVFVVHNGVSNTYFKIHDNYGYVTEEEILSKNYVLFVGSRSTYKNFKFAVEVLRQIKDFHFYVVGSSLTKQERALLDLKIPGKWLQFNNIDNCRLNELYNHACCLLYPSSYEGFGIPLLEAMKSGCPFIALNRTAIPEVAGDAGVLIDCLEVDECIKALEAIMMNRRQIIESGYEQAKKYSWDQTFEDTLKIYKDLYQR